MPCGMYFGPPRHGFGHRHHHHYGHHGRPMHHRGGSCHRNVRGGRCGGGWKHHRHGPPPFFHPYFLHHMMMMMGADPTALFTTEPVHDVTEDDASFEATVDLPGYKPNDIIVSIERNGRLVRVVASKNDNSNDNNDAKVEKVFKIHGMIDTVVSDTNTPTATLSHGVLTIKTKKDGGFAQVRQIPVSELVVEEASTATATAASIAPSAPPMMEQSHSSSSSSGEKGESDWIDVDEAEDLLSSFVEAATVANDKMDDDKTEEANKEEKKVKFADSPVATPPAAAAATAATAEPVDNSNEQHNTITIDLPGVRLQDLRVQLEEGGSVLRVSGVRRWGGSGDQSFERELLVGGRRRGSVDFDASQVHANLSYGVLTVTFPPRRESTSASTMILPVVEDVGNGGSEGVEATVTSAMAAMDMEEKQK